MPGSLSRLTFFCGVLLTSAFAAAGLLLAVRRLSGGIVSPLSASGMAAVAAAGLACTLLCDWLLVAALPVDHKLSPPRERGRSRSLAGTRLLARLGLAGFLWGASGAGGGPAVALIAGSAMALGVLPLIDARELMRRGWRGDPSPARPAPSAGRVSHREGDSQRTPSPDADARAESGPQSFPEGMLQQQIRTLTLTGGESIHGTAMIGFQTGVRTAVAHVGFCPPFWETPAVQLDTIFDEVEVAVTAAEILPWGVRIECRLEEPAEEPFTIPVGFIATAPLPPR